MPKSTPMPVNKRSHGHSDLFCFVCVFYGFQLSFVHCPRLSFAKIKGQDVYRTSTIQVKVFSGQILNGLMARNSMHVAHHHLHNS